MRTENNIMGRIINANSDVCMRILNAVRIIKQKKNKLLNWDMTKVMKGSKIDQHHQKGHLNLASPLK
jgi:2C-methyl-D-erythritol 2,4-cyclodiphosphate synthase